jgi:hypothetical protein
MIRIVKKAVQVAEIADDFRELGAQDRGMSAPFFLTKPIRYFASLGKSQSSAV